MSISILRNIFRHDFRILGRFGNFERDFADFARHFEIFSYFVEILVFIGRFCMDLGFKGFRGFSICRKAS